MNSQKLNILAIDTSLGSCSVALWQEYGISHALHEARPDSQSRRLLPMIEQILRDGGITYHDCDAIACTIGPGGFTGIRVGLSTARALTLATGRPLIGLTTLETIAFAAHLRGDILAVIDAYRGQYYVQRFRRMETIRPVSDPMLVDEAFLSSLAHGAKTVQELPKAEDVAMLAHAKWMEGLRKFPSAPLYIRAPDAKIQIKQRAE